ncbi:MAG: putative D-alanyl-D-alanine carboxypeptidase [Actinomycetota bacterium]|jgi:D-alanyl-D-alanine carboxypeptidase/D-alanyl-D-alanine-endopeptidase (penicillin-binding protein 4)
MRRTWLPLTALLALLVAMPAYAAPQSAPTGPAEAVLALPDASATGAPTAVADVLDPLFDDPALGGSVGAIVLDVATGAVVYQREAAMPRSLASNQKVFTALAILDALGPEGVVETTVTWDATTSTLTLVGAGDPTLASVAASGSSLADLADQVVGQTSGEVTLRYDTSLFDGPTIAPGWAEDYPALGIAAPVSPLVVDRSRIGGDEARQPDPARAAAEAFAAQLADRGVKVGDIVEGVSSGQVVATTTSEPIAAMVETMLTESDNDMAEVLAHLAGAQQTGAGSFASGAAATLATLQSLGIPASGAEFVDGSGLSYEDVASPLTLASAVALTSSAASPGWTWPVVLGLPVAGLTGTLADRFADDGTRSAAGFVRAKTGTLIGVSTLAGTVVDTDGRLLAFAFMSDETTDVDASRGALDRAAAALAACGCRG